MTIERFEMGFCYVVHCDLCNKELRLPNAEIFEGGMKIRGWKSRKDENNEWVNICPTCSEKELHEKGESG